MAAAKDLRKRTTALLNDIDATDASELRELLAEVKRPSPRDGSRSWRN